MGIRKSESRARKPDGSCERYSHEERIERDRWVIDRRCPRRAWVSFPIRVPRRRNHTGKANHINPLINRHRSFGVVRRFVRCGVLRMERKFASVANRISLTASRRRALSEGGAGSGLCGVPRDCRPPRREGENHSGRRAGKSRWSAALQWGIRPGPCLPRRNQCREVPRLDHLLAREANGDDGGAGTPGWLRSISPIISPIEIMSSCSRIVSLVPTHHPFTKVPFLLPRSRILSMLSFERNQNAMVPADELTLIRAQNDNIYPPTDQQFAPP